MIKKKFIKICQYCKKEIIGFSENHVNKNLKIHKKYSERCKYIKKNGLELGNRLFLEKIEKKRKKNYEENKNERNKRRREYYKRNRKKVLGWNKKSYQKHKKERSKHNIEYMRKHPEKKKKISKRYRNKNREKLRKSGIEYSRRPEIKKRNRDYRKKNKELISEKHKIYYNENKEIIKSRVREYSIKNKTKIKEKKKKYCEKNRKNINGYHKRRRKEDLEFKLRAYLRNRLNSIFKKYIKSKKIMASKKYGIEYQEIIEHLKPFPKDYLEKPGKWHMDHIRPLRSFNFVNPDGSVNIKEIQKAHNPKNFQWLLAKDNLSKGSMYNGKRIKKER